MQRLVVDIDERYINLVIDLLSNLKDNIVKNIIIENSSIKPMKKNIAQLNRFHNLTNKSNNQIPLTMKTAINTDEMVNDGLFF
jgi:hypothetical protein